MNSRSVFRAAGNKYFHILFSWQIPILALLPLALLLLAGHSSGYNVFGDGSREEGGDDINGENLNPDLDASLEEGGEERAGPTGFGIGLGLGKMCFLSSSNCEEMLLRHHWHTISTVIWLQFTKPGLHDSQK